MKINHFQITSAAALNLDFTATAPICVLRSRYSELVLDMVSSLGRQVFISVCANYPTEKLKHDKVQVINMEVNDVEN